MGNSLHRSQLEPTVAYRSAVSLETTEIPHSARSSFRTQFEDNSDWWLTVRLFDLILFPFFCYLLALTSK